MSTGILQKGLKDLLSQCVVDPSDYVFHSCKLGATTLAGEKGANDRSDSETGPLEEHKHGAQVQQEQTELSHIVYSVD